MAEEAIEQPQEAAPAKKKGKLPVLLALVLVLGGGGFFVMKSKGNPAKVEVKLGEVEQLEEFLVNLRGQGTYLRAEIALQLKEGFSKEELVKNVAAVRDAILTDLSAKSLYEVSTAAGKAKLKREIAESVNAVLKQLEEKKNPKKDKPEPANAKPKIANPEWESQEGPVLRVYFSSFATQ